MNIFYKAFCRIYQFCFKLALPILPYRKPAILDSEEEIVDVLKKENINKIMVATGQGIVKAGLLQPLLRILDKASIEYVVYDGTVPNPTINNIEEARKLYLENNLEGIVALGGGSVLDLAKVVLARVVKPKKSVQKMNTQKPSVVN
jgi:alcohol dehydrogenase class IV